MNANKRWRWLVFLVPSVGLVSCEDPLEPPYVLDRPRILAVRSEPPDLLPDSGVTLDALVFAPHGTTGVSYEWSWCASVDTNLQCSMPADQLAQLLDPSGSLGLKLTYALGSAAEARLVFPVDPDVLRVACNVRAAVDGGDAGDDGGAEAGTDTVTTTDTDSGADAAAPGRLRCASDSATVTVLLTATVGGVRLQAAKDITVYFTPPTTSNTNPTIWGLGAYSTGRPVPPDGGDRSDDAIWDAAGPGEDASVGLTPSDDGGIQLVLHVPSIATDAYERGRGPTGDGGATDSDGGLTIQSLDLGHLALLLLDGGATDAGGAGHDGGATDAGGAPHDGGSARPNGGADAGPVGDDDGGAGPVDTGGGERDGGGTGRGPALVYESLSATWYVQAGLVDSTTTNLPATSTSADAGRDWVPLDFNRWVPPGDGTYTVIVILRDNRGGVGWYTTRVTVKR
jgi:hypothetical protein